MMKKNLFARAAVFAAAFGLCAGLPAGCATPPTASPSTPAVRLMTLDPGHFHAALVQKFSYADVDPVVHVYAPAGPDLQQHLARIEGYNTRADQPTAWQQKVHTGADFFEQMIAQKPGNVVVTSGNNAKKARYILDCVRNGLNVLADKPMAITPADFALLKQAFAEAKRQDVLLYDIMTERYEITSILQRELSRSPALFGTPEEGSPAEPAVTKESVHHFFKEVSGKPLVRPPWFYDTTQQGEGIVDVTTHLVDLIQWACFPEQTLKPGDVKVLSAKRWATKLTPEQFKRSTGLDAYPDYLKPCVNAAGELEVFANGEFTYTLRGVHAKVSVIWNYEAPAGTGDTHYSILRGSKADLVIRQGAEQGFKPTLYVEKKTDMPDAVYEAALKKHLDGLKLHPTLRCEVKRNTAGWEIVIPQELRVNHEAHFAQVTEKYLRFLKEGSMPAWEVPNMMVKYHTIMQAYEMSRPGKR